MVQPFDFYLLRLPVLSLSGLLILHAQPQLAQTIEALHTLYQAPLVQEAIYLASPELHQQLLKWLAKPAADQRPEDERLVLTLYKYLVRMSSRCTPYGLFAGFSTGQIADAPTHWQLAPVGQRAHKHARLDMNYVAELAKQVVADPQLKTKLRFTVNSSLYKTKGAYRYYEYRMRNKRRHYQLVSIGTSTYVDLILEAAWQGAPYEQLLALLLESGIAPAAAAGFLGRLIDAQVLLSELEPTVTGQEFYHYLVDKVAAISPQHPSMTRLRDVQTLLAGSRVDTSTYQAVETIIREDFPASSSKDLIQTDLRLGMVHNTLNTKVVSLLSDDLQALSVLYKSSVPADLSTFISKFAARYEEQEIPLLEALDSEAGLGYGSNANLKTNYTPFVEGLRAPGKATTPQVSWTAYRQLVFRKLQESQQQQLNRVMLTAADLAGLVEAGPVPLPASFYAIGSMVAAGAAALDSGDFKFQLIACYGPGAMTLMARFAHADPALATKLVTCGQREQQAYGDVLLAEVVHLPEARAGNVLQRPQLRDYEIPFLGAASVPAERQILMQDLLLSVRHGRLVLRSQRLNKVIVPRLTTAHHYGSGLPVYKFLGDLQRQEETAAIFWDWGVLRRQSYLPRVEYGHLILSRAQWNLPVEAQAEADILGESAAQAAFRQRYGLPERVVLADGDNELLLDFACPLAWQLLAQRLKKGPATLLEFLHSEASDLVTDEQRASYANEIIIPFATTSPRPCRPAVAGAPAATPCRSFSLGSEWTYLKVYCGPKWADKILTDYLRPCLAGLQAEQIIEQWFFIRYADPHPHLRLRLHHAANPLTLATIVSRLHQTLAGLQAERVVQDLQYDTYYRELERYGAATMEFSETIFYHDSQAVLHFLDLLAGNEGERYRWLFAIRGVDQLLNDFGLSLVEKAALAEQSQRDFFQEFNGNANLTRQLNDKYREVSREVTSFLHTAHEVPDLAEAVSLFDARSAGVRAAYQVLAADLGTRHPTLDVAATVRQLLPSFLHMFLNRIFLANQRLHELVVYHYLVKYYATVKARTKQRVTVAA